MSKESSDFRYNTGDTKVPWAAVGENYNAADTLEFVKFLMQGKGKAYDAALKDVKAALAKLGKVSVAPGKLSMGDKVNEVERMVDKYLGVEEGSSLFVTLRATSFGSMLTVTGSTSAKTSFAPTESG